jgi:hypothetical protein
MANDEHVALLKQGVDAWNEWRRENSDVRPDLSGANLGANLGAVYHFEAGVYGANLGRANLSKANLGRAYLNGADLTKAEFQRACFVGAKLIGANLREARLIHANFLYADLGEADLSRANLGGANLSEAKLCGADLSGAYLYDATLNKTDFTDADLTGCSIYGVSAWGLKSPDSEKQHDLIITRPGEPTVTVDNIEVAQFVYLLLHNEKIRDVIDTIGKKGVLLLGRFTGGRMVVLERLREKLRSLGYVPMVFNFVKPKTKDFSETVRLLCNLSHFVIVDITNPRSAPLELQATVPDYVVPFAPILQQWEERGCPRFC